MGHEVCLYLDLEEIGRSNLMMIFFIIVSYLFNLIF